MMSQNVADESSAASPASSTPPCDLSVVVGSVNSARAIVRCLNSLTQACRGLDAEIIVVDASSDETVERIREFQPGVRVRRMPPGTLTPVLWSAGLAMSRGRVVAFTTGHFSVAEGWARSLVAGIASGATGVAGSLSPAADSDSVDWAVFYLRYSAFLGAALNTDVAGEIPGDNAAYRRDVLDRHAASFAEGFWEVDFHRRARRDDATTRLRIVDGAEARFGPSDSLASFARQRFAHGSHFGAWRVRTGARSAWQVVAAAPAVPALLIARIARRVLPRSTHRARFLASLPVVTVLATAWALGEAWGALTHTRPVTVRQHGLAA